MGMLGNFSWGLLPLQKRLLYQACVVLIATYGFWHAKGRGWLPFIGKSVTLCARATQAILNHTPIGEFKQHFLPAEYTQYLCGHCQVETRWHIFANCCRFAHFPLTDLVPTVKNFVKFLKKHPSAFVFPSQDRLFSEPPELPWVSHLVSLFLCCR